MRDRHRARWEEWEYRALFDQCPAAADPPAPDVISRLAGVFERSDKAVRAQWGDAHALARGWKSAASEELLRFLQRRGEIRATERD